ncbi:unnamed protein product [Brassica oleracea var. botrytis]|nr:hypothetical protein Bca52824_050567 [Brassica carinata]
MVVPLPPSSQAIFYGVNNPFLRKGPKGFKEYKTLKNGNMFVRVDLPGITIKEAVKVSLCEEKKGVMAFVNAPKIHKHDSSHRIYSTINSLMCKRCKVVGFTSQVCDGVLRLVLTPTVFNRRDFCSSRAHEFPNASDPNNPSLTGRVLEEHPCRVKGSSMAYESKRLQNGSLYVRVDMPGVPKDRFTVSVRDGRVTVTGEAPAVSHDSGGRFYSGDVALLETLVTFRRRWIKTIAKNGVIRLIIPNL